MPNRPMITTRILRSPSGHTARKTLENLLGSFGIVQIDTGGGYIIEILGQTRSATTDKPLWVTFNPQTGRRGARSTQDLLRSMRDRAKLKVNDAMSALNRDVTPAVCRISAGRI